MPAAASSFACWSSRSDQPMGRQAESSKVFEPQVESVASHYTTRELADPRLASPLPTLLDGWGKADFHGELSCFPFNRHSAILFPPIRGQVLSPARDLPQREKKKFP